MLYLTYSMIPSVDLARFGVPRAKIRVSRKCAARRFIVPFRTKKYKNMILRGN